MSNKRITLYECTTCGVVLTDENRKRKKRNGEYALLNRCKECYSVYTKKYCSEKYKARKEANPEHHKMLTDRHTLKTRYGITPEYRDELFKNGCEVCGSFDRLIVEHDHETKLVRGCLCSPCNLSLGLLEENPLRMISLAAYILKHKEYKP